MATDTPISTRSRDSDDNGLVTAARRNHYLETIRKQNGWEDFPDCLPSAMRTTKGGKTTDFGNTKLRIIERIAINANFSDALAYFMVLTQDGSRILRLKDLEACADNFDKSPKPRPKRRASDGQDNAESAEAEMSPKTRRAMRPREPSLEAKATPDRGAGRRAQRMPRTPTAQPTTPVKGHVRSHNEISGDSMETLPIHPGKRQRIGLDLDFVIQPPVPSITVLSPNGKSGPQAVDLGNESTGDLPPPSPMRRMTVGGAPSRTSGSDPSVVFASIDRAFDKLLNKARSQHRLVYTVLEHRKELSARLEHPGTFGDLETQLTAAKDVESKARNDLEQAHSALDAMKAQYSGIDSSLSRALLATVSTELEKAQDAVRIASIEVERTGSILTQAQVHEESLPRAKEEVDQTMAQLQSQTGFWLKRLGDVGVEFTNQLTAMQSIGFINRPDLPSPDRHHIQDIPRQLVEQSR